jgi:hypothetical protein
VFKIYYENQNIKAITRKKLNYDFIIDNQLSNDFMMGLEKPCEYQIYEIDNKKIIYKIDKLNILKVQNRLFSPNNTITSNSIKITLYEYTNTVSIELTDKHKDYILSSNENTFKLIFQTDDYQLVFQTEFNIEELLQKKKIFFNDIDLFLIDKILCSACSLNIFIHKTKKSKLIEVNALIDAESEYPINKDADVEIQIYKKQNFDYAISVILKNPTTPNFDIDYWIFGLVDRFNKNKVYQWIKIPVNELLEKKQYHTGFTLKKRLKPSIIVGRNIFENTGVQWK